MMPMNTPQLLTGTSMPPDAVAEAFADAGVAPFYAD